MNEAEVREFIASHSIESVRVSFADLHGVSRGRVVPARAFLEGVLRDGMEMSNAVFVMDSSGGIAPGTSIPMDRGFPNWRMVPDLKTFGPVPWKPGEARVLCDVLDEEGEAVPVLPRIVLKQQLARLLGMGFEGRAAPEYEFYLFAPRNGGAPPEPVMPTVQYNSELKHAAVSHIFAPLLRALSEEGADVEALGQEYSPSQYELNLAHRPFLQAADGALIVKESVKEALSDQGFLATFMSKPLAAANGSGCHIHVSLSGPGGENLFADPEAADGLSDLCRRFIGGLLDHARALFALTNPTVNCYKRVVPGRFAPVNVSWGYDNRTCLIRVPLSRDKGTHIEFRAPSALANPYVALAALLAAGLDGVARHLSPSDPVRGDAYADPSLPPLPASLPEGLQALSADGVLREALGETFCSDFAAIKRHEAARFALAVTDWEWNEYLDMY